jgi:hypothetical protein
MVFCQVVTVHGLEPSFQIKFNPYLHVDMAGSFLGCWQVGQIEADQNFNDTAVGGSEWIAMGDPRIDNNGTNPLHLPLDPSLSLESCSSFCSLDFFVVAVGSIFIGPVDFHGGGLA